MSQKVIILEDGTKLEITPGYTFINDPDETIIKSLIRFFFPCLYRERNLSRKLCEEASIHRKRCEASTHL